MVDLDMGIIYLNEYIIVVIVKVFYNNFLINSKIKKVLFLFDNFDLFNLFLDIFVSEFKSEKIIVIRVNDFIIILIVYK